MGRGSSGKMVRVEIEVTIIRFIAAALCIWAAAALSSETVRVRRWLKPRGMLLMLGMIVALLVIAGGRCEAIVRTLILGQDLPFGFVANFGGIIVGIWTLGAIYLFPHEE